MTSLGDPSRTRRRPIFLGVVVPILYLLALTCAAVVASGRGDARPADLSLDASRPSRVPVARTARPVRTAHTLRSRRYARVDRHPRRAPRRAVVVPAAAPAVSRSDSGREAVEIAEVSPFVVRIAAFTTPATMQEAIDRCIGPVAIDWSADPQRWGVHPTEIAEHDFCGGSVFTSLATGRQVEVAGGRVSGLYVVDGMRRFVPSGASASELDGLGDVALQTCVDGGMILVGLERID